MLVDGLIDVGASQQHLTQIFISRTKQNDK
jgi:hypothetical protein